MNSEDRQTGEIAGRLREAREYIGLSQEEVAESMALSRPAITNIEAASRKVSAVELDKFARLYGRTAQYLLTGTDGTVEKNEKIAFLARATQGLSTRDMDELSRFADFLRNSKLKDRKK